MTCPPKPWETSCVNSRRVDGMPTNFPDASYAAANTDPSVSILQSTSPNNTLLGGGSSSRMAPAQVPPPVPPRPEQQQTTNSFSYPSYGGFNSYGSSLYNSHPYYGGMYGGSYGYGYNRLGYGTSPTNYYGPNTEANFVRIAEESSRQAFQSIESIVQAFASVSMMLESTYHAVYSSFRAVLGVADHFSRLKTHLSQILSTVAVIRTLRWIYRKILYHLGLLKTNPASEAAWSAAAKSLASTVEECDLKQSRSSWPIIMFFGVVLGAPWLIWRLLSSLAGNQVSEKWSRGEADHYVATAQYDFHGESPRELSFSAGDQIILAPKGLQPKVKGWLLASVDGKKVGLVPANYIKILGFRKAISEQISQEQSTAEQTISSTVDSVATPTSKQISDSSDQSSDETHEEFVRLDMKDMETNGETQA